MTQLVVKSRLHSTIMHVTTGFSHCLITVGIRLLASSVSGMQWSSIILSLFSAASLENHTPCKIVSKKITFSMQFSVKNKVNF